jgi:hypothetical protein
MGLVRLPCFFNCVQRIEKYSTTSSKMIKVWNIGGSFFHTKPWKQAPDLVFSKTEKKSNRNQHHPCIFEPRSPSTTEWCKISQLAPVFVLCPSHTHHKRQQSHHVLLCVQKLKIKHNHTNKCSPVCFACS